VIALAALNGSLPKLGVVAVAGLAAAVLLIGDRRTRALAMLGALILSPVLLLADIWNSPQLSIVHRHPLEAVVGAAVAIAMLVVLARVIAGRPTLFALLAMLALPFRIPIQAGGTTANLLVPLYLVVAAGSLAWIGPTLLGASRHPGGREPSGQPDASGGWTVWVQRLLGFYVVLYGVQAVYSSDFEPALQNMVFFYVPMDADAGATVPDPAGRARDPVLGHRVCRIRHQDDHPQPEAGRGQRPAHVFHRQLSLLRSGHLRSLSGAGDGGAGGGAAL
jgi:hypothetical protein